PVTPTRESAARYLAALLVSRNARTPSDPLTLRAPGDISPSQSLDPPQRRTPQYPSCIALMWRRRVPVNPIRFSHSRRQSCYAVTIIVTKSLAPESVSVFLEEGIA